MPQAHADAKLLHFDRPASESVPGLYYVLFKTEQELRQLRSLFADPTSGIKKPKVLRTIFQPAHKLVVLSLRH